MKNYLYFYLQSEHVQQIIKKYSIGATIIHASKAIPHIEVILPPIETQKKIADILEKTEQLRTKRESANYITNKILRAVFLQMFGDPSANPKGWETELLGSLLENRLMHGKSLIRAKVRNTPPGIPVLKLSALTDYGFDPSKIKYYENLSSNELKLWSLKKNDILISRSNTIDLVGRVGRYTGQPYPCIFPDLMIKVEPNTKIINPIYLEFYLRTSFVKKFFQRRARGTSGSMPKISNKDILDVEVCVPSIKLQNEFVLKIEKIEKIKEKQYQSTQEINQLFNTLMFKTFNVEH